MQSEHVTVRVIRLAVAAARNSLESRPFQDRDPAAVIANQPFLSQGACGCRDAGAAYSQHVGKKFVRDKEGARVRTVLCHEQPAGKPRIDTMKMTARGGLRKLRHEHVHITVEKRAKRSIGGADGSKARRRHAPRGAMNLYDRILNGCARAEDQRRPKHSLVADHADLEPSSAVEASDERDEPSSREVCVENRATGVG